MKTRLAHSPPFRTLPGLLCFACWCVRRRRAGQRGILRVTLGQAHRRPRFILRASARTDLSYRSGGRGKSCIGLTLAASRILPRSSWRIVVGGACPTRPAAAEAHLNGQVDVARRHIRPACAVLCLISLTYRWKDISYDTLCLAQDRSIAGKVHKSCRTL
jgi:hypothetical protein